MGPRCIVAAECLRTLYEDAMKVLLTLASAPSSPIVDRGGRRGVDHEGVAPPSSVSCYVAARAHRELLGVPVGRRSSIGVPSAS